MISVKFFMFLNLLPYGKFSLFNKVANMHVQCLLFSLESVFNIGFQNKSHQMLF